ncbi:MAG: radical SAM/SPASM domain-containing protein [Burkholderiales bacterium]
MNKIPDNYFRTVEFTLQAGCPVGCNFCPQPLFLKKYSSYEKKITINNFKLALLNLKNSPVRIIQFSGYSEPLYHENFSDFINLSVEAGFEIEVFTTLKGFNKERLKNVKDLPVKWQISIQPLGIQNRKGLKDDEAWNNIKHLLELNLKYKPIFRCVNLNLSISQKTQLIEKGKRIGIKNIIFTELETRAGNIVKNHVNTHGRKLLCKNNMIPVILPNGDVSLCCMDFGLRHIIGNIFKKPLKDILSADSLQKIIGIMYLKEKGSILCHTCEFAIPIPDYVSPVYYAKARKIAYSITNSILPLGSKRKAKVKAFFVKLKNLYK